MTGRKQSCNITPTFCPSMCAGIHTHVYSSTRRYLYCTTIYIQELVSHIQLQPRLRFTPPIYSHMVTRFKDSGACFYPNFSPSAIALIPVAMLSLLSFSSLMVALIRQELTYLACVANRYFSTPLQNQFPYLSNSSRPYSRLLSPAS